MHHFLVNHDYPDKLGNMPTVQLESTITCPECSHAKIETMPTDACRYFEVVMSEGPHSNSTFSTNTVLRPFCVGVLS